MVHLCSIYAQFILNLLSFLILHMGPLLVCMYRARDYGVVGAAKPFPTQTIVQPDLTRVGTTQAIARHLSFHHVVSYLIL